MSRVKVQLLNKKKVKEFTLETAKSRAHKFTRVSGDFLLLCEGNLKNFIKGHIALLPSKGKTIN